MELLYLGNNLLFSSPLVVTEENEDEGNERLEKIEQYQKEKERTKGGNQTTENTIVIVISSVKLILPPVRCLAFPKIWVPAVDNSGLTCHPSCRLAISVGPTPCYIVASNARREAIEKVTFLFLSPRRAVSLCHCGVTKLNMQLDSYNASCATRFNISNVLKINIIFINNLKQPIFTVENDCVSYVAVCVVYYLREIQYSTFN